MKYSTSFLFFFFITYLFIYFRLDKKEISCQRSSSPENDKLLPWSFIRWRRGAKLNELRVWWWGEKQNLPSRCRSRSRRSGGRAVVLSNIKAAVRGIWGGKTGHFVFIIKTKHLLDATQAGKQLPASIRRAEPLVGAVGTCSASSGGKQPQPQKTLDFSSLVVEMSGKHHPSCKGKSRVCRGSKKVERDL